MARQQEERDVDRRHALGRLGGRLSLVFLQVFLERERLPAGAAGELTPCWVDGLGEFSKDFFEGGLRPRTSTGPARPSTSDGAGPGRFAPVIPPGSGW
ncbi:hypothetical protein BN9982_370029 [Mycobacterium tuberculosis]|nr:hypothetical protein BN9982_370029 [Mycobacterium tuberculosis]